MISDCKPPAEVLQLTCACVTTPACLGLLGLSACLQFTWAGLIFRGWTVCFCLCELGDSQTQLQILSIFMFLLSNKPFQCIFKISSFYCLLLVSSCNSLFWLIGSSFQKENLAALFSEVTVILIFAQVCVHVPPGWCLQEDLFLGLVGWIFFLAFTWNIKEKKHPTNTSRTKLNPLRKITYLGIESACVT